MPASVLITPTGASVGFGVGVAFVVPPLLFLLFAGVGVAFAASVFAGTGVTVTLLAPLTVILQVFL